MSKYDVEWSISARGVYRAEAGSVEEAEALVGDLNTEELLDYSDRFDFDTHATFVN